MVRKIGALFAGMVVVGVVVMTLQQIASLLHPLPAGLDPTDPDDAEALVQHLTGMPIAAWALAFFSEILGAFCGALTAGWIARDGARGFSGAIVGLALVGSVMNWAAFAHPTWFIVGQLVAYPLALMAVWALLAKRPPAEAEGRSA